MALGSLNIRELFPQQENFHSKFINLFVMCFRKFLTIFFSFFFLFCWYNTHCFLARAFFTMQIADGMTLEVGTVNLLLETHGGARQRGGAAWYSSFFYLLLGFDVTFRNN